MSGHELIGGMPCLWARISLSKPPDDRPLAMAPTNPGETFVNELMSCPRQLGVTGAEASETCGTLSTNSEADRASSRSFPAFRLRIVFIPDMTGLTDNRGTGIRRPQTTFSGRDADFQAEVSEPGVLAKTFEDLEALDQERP